MVSVIIPNYNHAFFITDRINSVLAQTYEDYEIIILDDFSVDNSTAIISRYRTHPKISLIQFNEFNSGSPFSQWNKGISLAKGELIWIAESDDMADPDFLKNLVPFFENDVNVGLAYCQSYRYSCDNEILGDWKFWTNDLDNSLFNDAFIMDGLDYMDRFLLQKNTIPNASAVLFRKKIYDQTGGADPTVKYCSDWLTWLKILTISKIAYTPTVLNYFRFHNKSVIATASLNIEDVYLPKYDRIMRRKLHHYFRANGKVKKIFKDMYIRNWSMLLKAHEDEGFFELKRKNVVSAWSNIFIAAFGRGIRISIIGKAIKNVLRDFYFRSN